MPLTGRFDFRKTFSGKLVLILEEDVRALSPLRKGSTRRRWRKATVMDLAADGITPDDGPSQQAELPRTAPPGRRDIRFRAGGR